MYKRLIELIVYISILGGCTQLQRKVASEDMSIRSMHVSDFSNYSNDYRAFDPAEIDRFEVFNFSKGFSGILNTGLLGTVWPVFSVKIIYKNGKVKKIKGIRHTHRFYIDTIVDRFNFVLEAAKKSQKVLILDISPVIADGKYSDHFNYTLTFMAQIGIEK